MFLTETPRGRMPDSSSLPTVGRKRSLHLYVAGGLCHERFGLCHERFGLPYHHNGGKASGISLPPWSAIRAGVQMISDPPQPTVYPDAEGEVQGVLLLGQLTTPVGE